MFRRLPFLRTILLYYSQPLRLLPLRSLLSTCRSLPPGESVPRDGRTELLPLARSGANTIHPRRIQQRAKPINRKPKYYWWDLTNVRAELDQFWEDCGVKVASTATKGTAAAGRVVIPNETLLLHYRRHDLRGAIASHGGRYAIAERLKRALPTGTTVEVLPGSWDLAVKASPELRFLVQMDPDLSMGLPPKVSSKSRPSYDFDGRRWLHRPTRRPKGYWTNRTAVIQALYEYVDDYKAQHQRPSVWMPRMSELVHAGRPDLKESILRFGGYEEIIKVAGMVPYRDWRYLEGQLELLIELRRYCDEHCNSDYTQFPRVSRLPQEGYSRLHFLIQTYGGRKFLASRLGMSSRTSTTQQAAPMRLEWGRFDLEFALRLLLFVRADQLRRSPPLRFKNQNLPISIYIPSEAMLCSSGDEGLWLREKIVEFGGHENVARRLGLEFSSVTL